MPSKPLASSYLSEADLAVIERLKKETGILTVRDADPSFKGFQFGPWVRPEDVVPGNKFPCRAFEDPVLAAQFIEQRPTPDRNRRMVRDVERISAAGFDVEVPIGCFRIESRAMQNSEKWDFIDTVYDITFDEKKRLRAYLEGRKWVTSDEAKKIEVEKERMRARAADAALDPALAAREAAKEIGREVAKVFADRKEEDAVVKRGRKAKADEPAEESVA